MAEDLAHTSGGACAGDRPEGRTLQLERKGLKEAGRGAIISGIKPPGLSVVFCVTSLCFKEQLQDLPKGKARGWGALSPTFL